MKRLPPAALARLALVFLALGAAHGVYAFARLFVSTPFAAILAAAFELTYIGLATLNTADADEQRRARRISRAAVGVSVAYNTLAALLARNPAALSGASSAVEALLALLFGAPLALVAYLLADLLLHRATSERGQPTSSEAAGLLATVAERVELLAAEQERLQRATQSQYQELAAQAAFSGAASSVQCEDCGREFASARALGGHRKSCAVRANGHAR